MASNGEERFAYFALVAGLPTPEREFAFAKPRRWRFDFAWPSHRVALEVEGGTWTGGRHTRGTGYAADCEKYAEAAIAGWAVIRATTEQVRNGAALGWVERAIAARAVGNSIPASGQSEASAVTGRIQETVR